MDEQMIEDIKEELVMISLVKDIRISENSTQFSVYANRRLLFTIYTRLKRNRTVYMTHYKGSEVPALETANPKFVVDQVTKWIEKETMK